MVVEAALVGYCIVVVVVGDCILVIVVVRFCKKKKKTFFEGCRMATVELMLFYGCIGIG